MLSRSTAIRALWPETPSARGYAKSAVSELRKVFQDESVVELLYDHTLLKLTAGIWVDLDASVALVKEAERVGYTTEEGFLSLQKAALLFARGEPLDGEDGLWREGIRETVWATRARCFLWLAESSVVHEQYQQAVDLTENLLKEDPNNV